jgi:hypothetical protein
MVTYTSGFIGNFKLGDNIVHNLRILGALYLHQNSNDESHAELLRKPIIIFIASIAEAILYDFYIVRIKTHTREGLPKISKKDQLLVAEKTIDEFAKYISHAKSKCWLGTGKDLYSELDELRKLRNRVHIQNEKSHFEADELLAFSKERQIKSETVLEQLVQYMSKNYLRSQNRQHVPDIVLPWNTRLCAPHNMTPITQL